MDASHLGPMGFVPHHPQHSSNENPTRPLHSRQEPKVEANVDKSVDSSQSVAISGLSPSGVDVRIRKARKTLVLCFDGTGNQFNGDSSDSNILKIFRMLDRSDGKAFHYYQPGIGTYIASASLSTSGSIHKLKNAYLKAKDSAIGTSFDEHVIGGYKFLMQFYSPGDSIYMFGFSRGSYTVRFLAEMIDWVGLITHGNEEMIQFAWKTFSKWKAMDSNSKEARLKQKKAYDFMVSFRETFSRPVRRIRFLGLFDTVNSVPRFENAIFNRQRIPFSAISSAKIIRHAVSIDERRAKFRADLVSHGLAARKDEEPRDETVPLSQHHHCDSQYQDNTKKTPLTGAANGLNSETIDQQDRGRSDAANERPAARYRGRSRARSHLTHFSNVSAADFHSAREGREGNQFIGGNETSSLGPPVDWDDDASSDGDENEQDIEELWFPGGHADIGGGWEVKEGETPLSHIPLVWIVREASKSGLAFDQCKMETLNCSDGSGKAVEVSDVPKIEISTTGGNEEKIEGQDMQDESKFRNLLIDTASKGMFHDCLRYGQGLPASGVLRWKIMEYLPFRRLDLKDDGKWKPIRWPLPRGEVRDMPPDAKVHRSAITRMENNPSYRPGNLIMGGGGRGVIRAPEKAGIGEWVVAGEEGDVVGERVIRKPKVDKEKGKHNGAHTSKVTVRALTD